MDIGAPFLSKTILSYKQIKVKEGKIAAGDEDYIILNTFYDKFAYLLIN